MDKKHRLQNNIYNNVEEYRVRQKEKVLFVICLKGQDCVHIMFILSGLVPRLNHKKSVSYQDL